MIWENIPTSVATQREFNGMKAPNKHKNGRTACITEAKYAAIINSVTLLQPFAMVHNQELLLLQAADYRLFRIFCSPYWYVCINFFFRLFWTKSKKWCQIIFMNLIHPNDLLTFDSANCPYSYVCVLYTLRLISVLYIIQ